MDETNARGVRSRMRACMTSLGELDRHARDRATLAEAFAPWCAFCAAAAEVLNAEDEPDARPDEDHAAYVNATPIARWILRRFERRFR